MPPSYNLSISRRTRSTPYTDRVTAAGVKAYTVYNHMLLATMFEDMVADYHHLKNHVQVWDVACERQIEVRGADAARLIQMLTPRDLRVMTPGQCYYTPMVDETGGMLNDPVTIKHDEDRFWVSIADSDLLFWIKGIAYGLRLEVDVREADIWPLAVQGPKADDLVARIFGDYAREIRFFRGTMMPFHGVDLFVARSGYSKQGGFEIYAGSDVAGSLWDALFEAGRDLDVRAGGPNLIERIEGGLLSYGNDMTSENTPHECGLDRFCQVEQAIGCVGRDALLRVCQEGPIRQIRSLSIEGDAVPPCTDPWLVRVKDKPVGRITSAVWSPDFETNVAIGMIRMPYWDDGTEVEVVTPEGPRSAIVKETTFEADARPAEPEPVA